MGANMQVKCYNFEDTQQVLGFKDDEELLVYMDNHDLELFTTPTTPGSGRARKRKLWYIRSTPEFDKTIKQQNLINSLLNKPTIKPIYKKYEPPQTIF